MYSSARARVSRQACVPAGSPDYDPDFNKEDELDLIDYYEELAYESRRDDR